MTKGELEYAKRKALNNFDKWNDATGYFKKGTSYYYEMQGIIEDSVRVGSAIASQGINADLSSILDEE